MELIFLLSHWPLTVVAFSLSKLNKKMPEIEAKIAADNAEQV